MDSPELDSMESDENDYETINWSTNVFVEIASYIIPVIILVFGLLANLLVVYSVLRNKSKQTVTNVFIANLAVANIILCLFVIPVSLAEAIGNKWTFGYFTCHLWPCIYYSVCYASTLTLAFLGVDHHSVTVLRLKETMKMRNLLIIIVIIWLVSIAAALLFGMLTTNRLEILQNDRITLCVPQNSSLIIYYISFPTIFVLFLVIPLVVMAYFYIALSIKMSTADCSTQMADERRTNRVIMAMGVVFCVFSMPYHITEITIISYWHIVYWKHILTVIKVVDILAASSTCFNPLFYTWLNKMTLKRFWLVGRCFKHQSVESSNVDTIGPPYTVHVNEDGADDVTYTSHCDAFILVSVERD